MRGGKCVGFPAGRLTGDRSVHCDILPGDLFSVSPYIANRLKDLFVLNERIAREYLACDESIPSAY